ncbi:MAG: hypothetical protein JJU24_12140 [Natronohydrobacter sp.]|nr:hypothetical protein [Natronohydrobacter sp.]
MRVAIIIPTTGGPSQILRLQPLRKAPCSLVFTQDDYKPIEISARYNDFVTAGGPLSRALDLPETRFELRLSRKIESGRSWELPVALAHWLQMDGHEIVAAESAELVIWSTGALNSDMQIIAQDYHLATKLALSDTIFARLASADAQAVMLLPAPLESALGTPAPGDMKSHVIGSLRDGMDVIRHLLSVEHIQPVTGNDTTPKQIYGRASAIALGIGLVAISGLFWVRNDAGPGDAAPLAQATIPDGPDPVAQAQQAELTSRTATLPELVIHHAPDGATCRAVLFGGREPRVSVHSAHDDVFDTGALDRPCALGLRLDEAAEDRYTLQMDDALRARILTSDFRPDYTLAAGQEIVLTLRGSVDADFDYSWVLKTPDGDITTLSHRVRVKTE